MKREMHLAPGSVNRLTTPHPKKRRGHSCQWMLSESTMTMKKCSDVPLTLSSSQSVLKQVRRSICKFATRNIAFLLTDCTWLRIKKMTHLLFEWMLFHWSQQCLLRWIIFFPKKYKPSTQNRKAQNTTSDFSRVLLHSSHPKFLDQRTQQATDHETY